MTAPPITLEVYDKTLLLRGHIAKPNLVEWTPRRNKPADLSFEIDLDHPRYPDLATEGARVVLRYHRISGVACSGTVSLSNPTAAGVCTVTVEDDMTLPDRTLAWVRPDQPLSAQDTGTYDRTGPAETVVKQVCRDNFARRGLPVYVMPDQGRGITVTGSWRMEPITDHMLLLLEQAGLLFTIRQAEPVPIDGGGMRSPGLVMEISEPRTYPHPLSYRGGTVLDWGYSKSIFKASRWVLGAQTITPGDTSSRVWAEDIDDIAESHWGPLAAAEVFIDAPSINSDVTSAQRDLTSDRDAVKQAGDDWTSAQAALLPLTQALQAAQLTFARDRTPANQDALNGAQDRYNAGVQQVLAKQATLAFTKTQLDAAVAQTVTAASALDVALRDAFHSARITSGASVALKVALTESSVFQFGDGLLPGDLIPIDVGLEGQIVQPLEQVAVRWDFDGGLVLTPQVGDYPTPTSPIWRVVADLARADRARRVI